ncbi:hypothetical protein ACFO5R_00325 [Halosolutus amylolyticus]|uniref:Polymer-forming cytoskeletal protein n=1 Tax=Halosolutus amylolyticus TaxID=2932267 RepID=A0ABD5PIJ8_9EURY|nr:hypothetical protein [Halosolutus amylolyticus]
MAHTTASACSYRYQTLSHTQPADTVDVPRTDPDGCPHPAADGEDDRCLFHATEREFPPAALTESFIDSVKSPERDATFAGGRLGDLDLSNRVLDTSDGEPIDLRGVTIDGSIDLTGAIVNVPLLLGNAALTGALEGERSTFEAPVDLAGTSVEKGVYLHNATFESGIAANGFEVASLMRVRSRPLVR